MRWLYLVTIGLFACSGDGGDEGDAPSGFSDDTSCGLALTLGGALTASIPPSRTSTACLTQTSSGSGLDGSFALVQGELAHIDLVVDDVMEGQTGDFPAHLVIAHDDGREWQAESCVAHLAEHEDVGPAELGWESYRIVGEITCDAPASNAAGSGPALEIEALSFVVTISWA